MRAERPERDLLGDMMRDAHAAATNHGAVTTREAAERFVASLEALEGSGHPWVKAKLHALLIAGASKACADWRRKQRTPARTRRGTPVAAPDYVGLDDDGTATQVLLATMTLPQLVASRERRAVQRDTASREIRLLDDLIALMESGSYATAGDALAVLMGQAAA